MSESESDTNHNPRVRPEDRPLFTVRNRHVSSCGTPPSISSEDFSGYLSYFENYDGEQAIYHRKPGSEMGTLYMGDAGWEKAFDVDPLGNVAGLILAPEEAGWLQACVLASALPRIPVERQEAQSSTDVSPATGVREGSQKLGVRDLVPGGMYLHRNGHSVRTIVAIKSDRVYWRDQTGPGPFTGCTRQSFVRSCQSRIRGDG